MVYFLIIYCNFKYNPQVGIMYSGDIVNKILHVYTNQDILNLSINELLIIFNIARLTLYSWIEKVS
jgi:hypothetical protein